MWQPGWKGSLEENDTCICVAESLPCSPETITTLLMGYCYCLDAKPCLTLCDSVDYSLPGSSVYEISQARILECIATSFSRGSSWLRDWTCIVYISGGFFTTETPGKLPIGYTPIPNKKLKKKKKQLCHTHFPSETPITQDYPTTLWRAFYWMSCLNTQSSIAYPPSESSLNYSGCWLGCMEC